MLRGEVLGPLLAGIDLGRELLEFGPGPGAATGWLCQRVDRLVAIELDHDAAARLTAEYEGGNVEVVVGDCARTPFADDSFDTVATFTMLHHLPTLATQYATLAEARRVLRPGGLLVGSDSLASTELHAFHVDDTYNPIDPARLLIVLQALGFERITLSVDRDLRFRARKSDVDQHNHVTRPPQGDSGARPSLDRSHRDGTRPHLSGDGVPPTSGPSHVDRAVLPRCHRDTQAT
jgi:SAM-dependent methyltransferase